MTTAMLRLRLLLLAGLLPLPLLPAQKLPVPGEPGRVLQLFDLRPLRPADAAAGAGADAAVAAAPFAGVDEFVRHFVVPPLAAGDDVRLLGPHHLALLGSPQQAAWVERLLAATVRQRDLAITVQVRLLELPAAVFQQHLRPLLGPARAGAAAAPLQVVLQRRQLETVLAAAAQRPGARALESPALTVLPLLPARMQVGQQIAFIRDFELERQGNATIANPVIDTLFDGQTIDVTAARLGGDDIAVQCEVTHCEVPTPLPVFETNLGVGAPVQIQLPRARTLHLQQRSVMTEDSAVLLASERGDGSWLCAAVIVVLAADAADVPAPVPVPLAPAAGGEQGIGR